MDLQGGYFHVGRFLFELNLMLNDKMDFYAMNLYHFKITFMMPKTLAVWFKQVVTKTESIMIT
jgi:hypothetical protein